jgi:hypothetical protein
MTDDDMIPTVGIHRGVGLHDHQSEARLSEVRRAIDAVFNVEESRELLRIAADPRWPPEARLLAAAKLEAMFEIATDERKVRPNFDLSLVRASVAGLTSLQWRDPKCYASLLDYGRAPGEEGPVKREQPLDR